MPWSQYSGFTPLVVPTTKSRSLENITYLTASYPTKSLLPSILNAVYFWNHTPRLRLDSSCSSRTYFPKCPQINLRIEILPISTQADQPIARHAHDYANTPVIKIIHSSNLTIWGPSLYFAHLALNLSPYWLLARLMPSLLSTGLLLPGHETARSFAHLL